MIKRDSDNAERWFSSSSSFPYPSKQSTHFLPDFALPARPARTGVSFTASHRALTVIAPTQLGGRSNLSEKNKSPWERSFIPAAFSPVHPSAAVLQLSEELGFLVLILGTWHSDTHCFSLTAPRFTSTHSAAVLPVSGNLSSTVDDAQLYLLTSSKRMKLNALSGQKHHTH